MNKESIPSRPGIYFFFMPKLNVGYIGRTNDLQRRFYEHTVSGSHKRVIKNYTKSNSDLRFKILEFTDKLKAKEQKLIEAKWLAKYRKRGIKLLNIADPTKETDLPEPKAVLKIHPESLKILKEYKSTFSASKQGFDASSIAKCCNKYLNKKGKGQLKHKGFFWIYAKDWQEKPELLKNLPGRRQAANKAKKLVSGAKGTKAVSQYTKSGIFIRYWESASIAARELKLKQAAINHCLRGRSKTSGNYIWKFKETLTNE